MKRILDSCFGLSLLAWSILAEAVAALFPTEAQIVDADDNTVQGRTEIEKLFAGVFEKSPETKIEADSSRTFAIAGVAGR